MKIDSDRCQRAMRNIEVYGKPTTESREALIEEAISLIQQAEDAFCAGYLGIKNYAQCGDQRCDCAYSMYPRHGTIVFRIGRTRYARENKIPLGPDEQYLLECVRDFGYFPSEDGDLNLCDTLTRLLNLQLEVAKIETFISGVQLELEGVYA